MRHDPRAGLELAPQFRLELRVDAPRQPQHHDGRRSNVRGEQIAFDERDAAGDTAFAGDLARDRDEPRLNLDPDAARAVFQIGRASCRERVYVLV